MPFDLSQLSIFAPATSLMSANQLATVNDLINLSPLLQKELLDYQNDLRVGNWIPTDPTKDDSSATSALFRNSA
jgi:hypothetical protein